MDGSGLQLASDPQPLYFIFLFHLSLDKELLRMQEKVVPMSWLLRVTLPLEKKDSSAC